MAEFILRAILTPIAWLHVTFFPCEEIRKARRELKEMKRNR